MSKKYLLDSDVFIHAKNSYLNPEIAPAFWDWLVEGHSKGLFFSIDKVANELRQGREGDFLTLFPDDNPSFFLPSNDVACMSEYGKLQNWAVTVWANGKKSASATKGTEAFASDKKADAFLVAYAKANGFMIITNEVSDIKDQTNIKVPDAAISCGLEKPISLVNLLLLHSHNNFQFK